MIKEVKGHLETVSSMVRARKLSPYSCIEDFVLKNGKEYKNATPYNNGPMGECYRNAFLLAERTGLTYVEGYAYAIAIPVLHAWVVDTDGDAFDPTWKDGQGYFGVEFSLNYVRKVMLRREAYGVLDCWEIGYPLLTGEDKYPQ